MARNIIILVITFLFTFSNIKAQISYTQNELVNDTTTYIYIYRHAMQILDDIKAKDYETIRNKLNELEKQEKWNLNQLKSKVDSTAYLINKRGVPRNIMTTPTLAQLENLLNQDFLLIKLTTTTHYLLTSAYKHKMLIFRFSFNSENDNRETIIKIYYQLDPQKENYKMIGDDFSLIKLALISEKERPTFDNIPKGRARRKGNISEDLFSYPNGNKAIRIRLDENTWRATNEAWYENGQKMIFNKLQVTARNMNGSIDEGFLIGNYIAWHENGKKMKEAFYKNGELLGIVTEWYRNGQIKQRIMHKDNRYNGPFELWYQNGQIKEKGTFKKSRREGLWTEWDSTGVKQEGHYGELSRKKEGKWIIYDKAENKIAEGK